MIMALVIIIIILWWWIIVDKYKWTLIKMIIVSTLMIIVL